MKNSGFTLMELMVVIAIIVLLAGIMVPNLANRIERAKITKTEADIAGIEGAIAMYETDTGRYPEDFVGAPHWWMISSQVLAWRLTGRDPDGNMDSDVTNDPNWHGPYIKGIEKDPWGTDYWYMKNEHPKNPQLGDYPVNGDGGCVEPPNNLSYYIVSKGKNRLTSSDVLPPEDYDNIPTNGNRNDDDINNWDVNKRWREAY